MPLNPAAESGSGGVPPNPAQEYLVPNPYQYGSYFVPFGVGPYHMPVNAGRYDAHASRVARNGAPISPAQTVNPFGAPGDPRQHGQHGTPSMPGQTSFYGIDVNPGPPGVYGSHFGYRPYESLEAQIEAARFEEYFALAEQIPQASGHTQLYFTWPGGRTTPVTVHGAPRIPSELPQNTGNQYGAPPQPAIGNDHPRGPAHGTYGGVHPFATAATQQFLQRQGSWAREFVGPPRLVTPHQNAWAREFGASLPPALLALRAGPPLPPDVQSREPFTLP